MAEKGFPMKINLAVTLAILLAATFGCKKSRTVETADGAVQMSESDGTTRIEVNGKDGKATIAASETKVAIPDTFPKDVPILKGAVPKLTMTQGKSEVLHLVLPQSVAEIAKDYQEKLKAEGWAIETSMNVGDGSMIQAKKDKRTCGVMVLKNEDGGGTMVQLSVTGE
jgi:hypothetical protein